tara:strand:- start:7785 stop:8078 length:294 start_codon:yes stop_codon:yes gene_type:complete
MYTVLNTIKSQGFNKLQLQKLAKNESFEILSITLEKGAVFPTHTSPMEALLIVIEGEIVFHIRDEEYHLRNQQHFSFPKEIEHWVNANENSKFIIVR